MQLLVGAGAASRPGALLGRAAGATDAAWLSASQSSCPRAARAYRCTQVAAATFGMDGDFLPAGAAHPAVVSFIQGSLLIAGLAVSTFFTNKMAGRPSRMARVHVGVLAALTAGLWWTILQ